MKVLRYFLFISLLSVACRKEGGENEAELFRKLDPAATNVNFVNQVTETADFNILDYLYFFNGGGVAVGDINNDGFQDVFFVSNQGKNKLYLNKGNKAGEGISFEDISEKAGIGGYANWQTGVTMADVNGDGLLDIYVCAVSNFEGLEGTNELYINNGDLTFTEKAADYGLDFSGFSTQAAFFDYDRDGDLDCYLLNHAVHNTRSYDRVSTRMLKDNEAGDYLFRNDNGKFRDVSHDAGIYQAAMGYGLGISVADLNNDGWLDIYVGNDFHEDDYYYINQKDGTFKEDIRNHFRHLSRFSMGNDAADINNDGYLDVMTLDMYPEDEKVEKSSAGEDPLDIYLFKLEFGYFNQYSRNCLQLNLGGRKFSDVAAMSGVAATDWSWSTLLADYDGDGIKDIFVTNGIVRRPNDLDYMKFITEDSLHYNLPTSEKLDKEAMDKMPDGKWHNYLYRGTPGLQFEDKSVSWGFGDKSVSNGSAYADLDNDGDLDLIVNNLNEEAGIYENQSRQLLKNNYLKIILKGEGKNTFGIGARAILKYPGGEQVLEMMPTRGFMSAVEPGLLFGLGKHEAVDSLTIIWGDGKTQTLVRPAINSTLILAQEKAAKPVSSFTLNTTPAPLFEELTDRVKIPYRHRENIFFDFNRELLIPFKASVEGPALAIGDVNGDGLEDFFAGGAKYQAGELFLQTKNGFTKSFQPVFEQDSLFEDVDALFLDVDGDNDLDLYVVSGGNEFYDKMPQQFDRLYLNDGKGHFTRTSSHLPPMYDNKSCVRACDFDGDGDLDLFVGGRVVAYRYGDIPSSYLLVNDGTGRFTDQTDKIAPGLRKAGMVTDAIWADLDGDGKPDLTVAGDWMPVKTYFNRKGSLKAADNGLERFSGFWNGIAAADFDKDGDIDLVVGNLGTNTKYLKEKNGKLRMQIKDIDGNGTNDHIVSYNRGDKWYPANLKDELGKQMPGIINRRFTTYSDFAGKTVEELFTQKELDGAEERIVNTFESLYLENTGKGSFLIHPLPRMSQVSKTMTAFEGDFNGDGNPDVILGGNYYGASMYQGRYDASYGLVLQGDGKGQFRTVLPTDTGMILEGEIRKIRTIRTPSGVLYLIARNNDTLQIFRHL